MNTQCTYSIRELQKRLEVRHAMKKPSSQGKGIRRAGVLKVAPAGRERGSKDLTEGQGQPSGCWEGHSRRRGQAVQRRPAWLGHVRDNRRRAGPRSRGQTLSS